MAKPHYIAVLPLILVAWLTPSLSTAAEESEAVRCEIRTTAVSGGLQLQPVASVGTPIAGTYEFVATSRADGSRSNTSQSGTFDLDANEESVLSSTLLSTGDNTSIEAHLTLRSDDQDVVCRDEYSGNE